MKKLFSMVCLSIIGFFGGMGMNTVKMLADVNPIVQEQRSISAMQDTNNIFDDVAALEADNLLQGNAINGNATAINENAILGNGLSDRVDVIETEMLNVDRYDVVCTIGGTEYPTVFKHHYDASFNIEYGKIQGEYNSFIFGDYEDLKSYMSSSNINAVCPWW